MRMSSPRVRGIAALSTVAAAALALTACSGTTSSDTTSTAAADEPVTLSYAIWDQNQQPAMEEIVAAFEKEHPNVTIDIQLTPNKEYWTKLQTAIAGGSGPDVFWMNGTHFQLYAANGVLAPLDGGLVDTANYPQSLVDLYTFDGTSYGAPKDYDTIALWYNKDLFDKAGVDYPTADWTWQDAQEIAAKLTDKGAGVYGFATPPYSQEYYYDTIAQAGGFVISPDGTKTGYDSPEALKGIEYLLSYIEAGSSPTAQQMTDTSPGDMFISGKIAMLQTGSWDAIGYKENPDIADKVDVQVLPAGPAGNQSVIHGLANVANAASPNVEIAKQFAAFASGEQASQIQAASGTVIPAFNGLAETWVQSMPNFNLKAYVDEVDTSVPYPVSKNTSVWTGAEGEILSQVWAGKLSAADGLQQLADAMQKALDEENK
ncbi:ABC transporter substrate-binding protein [Microbacterium sp.]|uniref:ABC transporter substrate-binding protein n=1 Tax=Microbacterium sp. TaxID=51671 RepID=UPI003A8BD48C